MQHDRVFTFEFDFGLGVLQIKAGVNFFGRLLDGVRDLFQIDLAHDVKGVFGHVRCFPEAMKM
jgi:hypothetical protein